MTETKLALMERLRKEKRWDEAERFREETRTRLRSEGMRRAVAREEAWRLTAERFPVAKKAKADLPTPNGQRIEAVKEGVVINHTDEERRQLIELAARPDAWTTKLSDAIERVVLQSRKDVGFAPTEANSVLEWLLWKLREECDDLFILISQMEYLLRHGESLVSIAWPKATDLNLRLRYQFIRDMKSLGQVDQNDPCMVPTNAASVVRDEPPAAQ